MTRWQSTRLVAGREIREALRRKSFWIIVGVLVAGSTAGVLLPEVLGGNGTKYDVVVVAGSPDLEEQLDAVADSIDAEITLSQADSVEEASQLVADEDVDVAVIAGDAPTVIAKQDRADAFVATAQQVVGVRALADRLQAEGLSRDEVGQVLEESTAKVVRLDQDEASRQGSAAIVSTVLYILLLMLMIAVANGTAIEKANRISEVLLAIVRPGALLFGKVIGVGAVGLGTLVIGVLPPLIRVIAGGGLPAGLGAAMLGGGPWLLMGMVLYLTTAGALGALVERQEEAGSVVTPLTLILVFSLIVGQSASSSPLGRALAIFPFTSPMVMPSRIALGEASAAEMAVSLGVGIATVLVAVRIGSRIYARAIVRTGRRLKVREVLAGA